MELHVDIDKLKQIRAWLTLALMAMDNCLEFQDELMTERLGLAKGWSEQVVDEITQLGEV